MWERFEEIRNYVAHEGFAPFSFTAYEKKTYRKAE